MFDKPVKARYIRFTALSNNADKTMLRVPN